MMLPCAPALQILGQFLPGGRCLCGAGRAPCSLSPLQAQDKCRDLCLTASAAGPGSLVRVPCHIGSCSRCPHGGAAAGQEHLQLAGRVRPGAAPARQLLWPQAMPSSTPQPGTCTAQQLRALSYLSVSLWGEACSTGLLSPALLPAAQPVGVFTQKGNRSAQHSLHGLHVWGRERAGSQTSALVLPALAPATSVGQQRLAQAPRGGQKRGCSAPCVPQPSLGPHGAKQGCGVPQLRCTRVDRMR